MTAQPHRMDYEQLYKLYCIFDVFIQNLHLIFEDGVDQKIITDKEALNKIEKLLHDATRDEMNISCGPNCSCTIHMSDKQKKEIQKQAL